MCIFDALTFKHKCLLFIWFIYVLRSIQCIWSGLLPRFVGSGPGKCAGGEKIKNKDLRDGGGAKFEKNTDLRN